MEDLDFCKSRIYKKRKNNNRVSENRGDNLSDVVRKAPRAKPVDAGDADVSDEGSWMLGRRDVEE